MEVKCRFCSKRDVFDVFWKSGKIEWLYSAGFLPVDKPLSIVLIVY